MEERVIRVKKSSFATNIVAIIFSLRCLYYVWLAFDHLEYSPIYYYFMTAVRYIAVVAGVFYIIFQKKIEFRNLFLLTPLVFYFLILYFHTYGGYQGTYLDELICIGCFLLMDSSMKKRILFFFYKIVVYSSLISIVLYILYSLNVPVGFKSLPFLTDEGLSSLHTEYQQWFIFAFLGNRKYSLIRLCGLFNEPGGLATVCSLLYVIMYKTSNKFEKTVLLVSIFLSFSVAGYLLILFFYALLLLRKNWKYSLIVVLFIVAFLLLPYIDFKNTLINKFVQRFAITSEGLAGNNRTDAIFDADFETFLHSQSLLFGYGARYSPAGSDSSTYKIFILQFGFLGFALYFGMWLFLSLFRAKKNYHAFLLIVVFFLSIYQRPMTMINSYGYLIMFGGIEWIINYHVSFSKRMFKRRNDTPCVAGGVTNA